MSFYITINSIPACSSPLALAGETCAQSSLDDARALGRRVLDVHHDAEIGIHKGMCPRDADEQRFPTPERPKATIEVLLSNATGTAFAQGLTWGVALSCVCWVCGLVIWSYLTT